MRFLSTFCKISSEYICAFTGFANPALMVNIIQVVVKESRFLPFPFFIGVIGETRLKNLKKQIRTRQE